MSYHDTDGIKRDLERGDQERDRNKAKNTARSLETAELTRRIDELRARIDALEANSPSSTAELLALAWPGCWGCSRTTRRPRSESSRRRPRSCPAARSPLTAARTSRAGTCGRRVRATSTTRAATCPSRRSCTSSTAGTPIAIVLAGGYMEERGDDVHVVLPGTVNVIRGDDFHRVDLLNPAVGSWSLFVAGRKTGGWGFRDKATGAYIPQKDYLAAKGITE